MRWGRKHDGFALLRAYELSLELLAAGQGSPGHLIVFVDNGDAHCAEEWRKLLREAGFSKQRAEEEVRLVFDLVEGRVIRQALWVAISETGHACGPTRESVAGDGGVIEQATRYRSAPRREAA